MYNIFEDDEHIKTKNKTKTLNNCLKISHVTAKYVFVIRMLLTNVWVFCPLIMYYPSVKSWYLCIIHL